MNKTAKYLFLTACALAASLFLSGCGGAEGEDSVAPTVAITSVASDSDVRFTFTFSEDIGSSFTADDVAVVGGTKKASVTKIDGTNYTLAVTPDTGASEVTASLATGKFSDMANNTNTASATNTFAAGSATAPTTAPTAPTALAANVKSLYSDAYTTTGGFDLPYWGQGQMLSDATIANNKVLKGDAFTYQGFQFDPIDATSLGLTSLHIDIWSVDATPVKVYVISNGQDTESVDIVPTAGAWKGVDIPLSSFTKINKGAIFQLKLDTAIQPTTKAMYFDNIYLTK
ncbi:MAG: Ig-like domain-containing protein [Rhodoferax sp.]|nr:Ig-like domain-containing protein [Rhodoferax sp.]